MPDTNTSTPGITSPQDRIAILEDLVEFHRERAHESSLEILRILAELRSAIELDGSTDNVRAALVLACAQLAALGMQLSSGNLVTEETHPALKGWPFMAPSAMLS
ncbi:hypothetical protein [Paraburkholderia adhaesiva]|uniref:hypothetical protein n=1 Tax=Paraburkholderia adhaesiva TaxID=2883244 RepID=UPI001F36ED81|nr:hypothetical protein [Paraburkholderia adhaesiva]